MKGRAQYLAVVLLLGLGCSSGVKELRAQLEELNTRLREVQRDVDILRQELKKTQDEQEVLRERLTVLWKRVKRRRVVRTQVLQTPVPTQIPVQHLVPQGPPAESESKGIEVEKGEDGYDHIIVHYDQIDQEEGASPPPARPKTPIKASTDSTQVSPQALYKRAFDAYRHGEIAKAVKIFSSFVSRYPKHELADNALYWIGECYYDQRDFSTARTYFTRVITDYPSSNKVPDAMLKLGMCNEMEQRFEDAKRLFKAVMLSYPDSQAAKIAMQRIKSLR